MIYGLMRGELGFAIRTSELGVRFCPNSSIKNIDIEDSEDTIDKSRDIYQAKRSLEVMRDETGKKLDELKKPLSKLDVQFYLARLQALNQAIEIVDFYMRGPEGSNESLG